MSLSINGGAIESPNVKIADNSATVLYLAVHRTMILSIVCTENTGSATPALTLEKYDGTNSYYLRKAVAMVAGMAVIFNEPFSLPAGWSIRATSGDAAGKIDASVSYLQPSAARGS